MELLTLPGILDSLDDIRQYIRKAAQAAGLSKKLTYRLQLAVDEIATNAVIHGYNKAGLQGDLRVQATIDEQTLAITLEDRGYPFDPRSVPMPTHKDLPIEERPIGGLGVYLTLKGVDEFQYDRVGTWNRCIFIMQRNQPTA